MTTWTDSARRCFADYAELTRASLKSDRVDVNEVLEDLERHVNEEVRSAGLTLLTEEQLRLILSRIGDPVILSGLQSTRATPREGELTIESDSQLKQTQVPEVADKIRIHSQELNKAGSSTADSEKSRSRPGIVLLVLGVLMPVIAVLVELFTGFCAGVLFDPLPSWLHVVIVALVPVSNLWLWLAARSESGKHARLLGWLNGAALGVSLFYALLYLPACLALIYLAGVLPLAPLLASIATPLLRARYVQRLGRTKLPGLWAGSLATVALLATAQIPSFLTYLGLANAAADDLLTSRNGVRLLRRFGDESMLLRACYGQLTRPARRDLIQTLATGNVPISADRARTTYYRVTGRPFNSMPPPTFYTKTGRWDTMREEYSWEDRVGGDAVAGRIKGLSLTSSRLDAKAEPDAALVYCEWTMEFQNVSSQPQEIRAQIALPPGGVVSRLTLWLNGEEREAAFAGRAAAKETYRQVATAEQRDPVLLTTCGPDRVLLQCFNLSRSGGVMKVRVGMTSPLILETAPEILESLNRGRFVWPRLLERNFTVPEHLRHMLWLESPDAIEGSEPTATQSGDGKFAWRNSLTERDLEEEVCSVVLRRPGEVFQVWFPGLTTGEFVRQTIALLPKTAFNRVVLVVDGSFGMKPFLPEVTAAFQLTNAAIEIAALVAADRPNLLLAGPQKATPAALAELQQKLTEVSCEGGQDNLPALEQAWDLAAESGHSAVIWVHAPQAALLSAADALRQRFDRAGSRVSLYELQVRNGPDRVMEKLDNLAWVHAVPRTGALSSNLAGLCASLASRAGDLLIAREIVRAESAVARKASTRHIERLWAREEVNRRMAARDYEAATELAGRQQIVTPCSGAVVLANRQQFEQHKLTPADPRTVPAIPEPETWALLACGILLLLFAARPRRLRRRA